MAHMDTWDPLGCETKAITLERGCTRTWVVPKIRVPFWSLSVTVGAVTYKQTGPIILKAAHVVSTTSFGVACVYAACRVG